MGSPQNCQFLKQVFDTSSESLRKQREFPGSDAKKEQNIHKQISTISSVKSEVVDSSATQRIIMVKKSNKSSKEEEDYVYMGSEGPQASEDEFVILNNMDDRSKSEAQHDSSIGLIKAYKEKLAQKKKQMQQESRAMVSAYSLTDL